MPWNAMIHGTNASEKIDAADGVTDGDDAIWGHMGDDAIFGLGGNDAILGGLGADYMDGGAGVDQANYAESGAAVVVSLLSGMGQGGDAQGDTLVNFENLAGSSHNDTLVGDAGANDLWGLIGNDLLIGGSGNDSLRGDYGDDTLKGGGGADRLNGGDGNDTAAYNDSTTGVAVSLMSGTGSGGDAHGDILLSVENLTGSEYDDRLWGNDENNVLAGRGGEDWLKGYGGADTLWGGDGNDNLNGGAGADTMIGGSGNDTYSVDHWWDVATEAGGQGIDVVRTSANYALTAGSDVEVLETTSQNGTAALVLLGNANGNVVRGNNGDNVIGGGDGNDELTGFGGHDAFLFSTALNAATNVDVITDFNVADDTIRLDQDIFASLGLGNIADGELVIGPAALDANDHIIYDSNTGALYYDSDGAGSTAAIRFAELSPGLALTNLDFFVV
jgi:Ca2+-binding RTX toxin-like protein